MVGCYIVGCKSGYGGGAGHHLFRLPRGASQEIRQQWKQNIPKRSDKEWDFKSCHLCHHHFKEPYIIKTHTVMMGTTVVKEVKRKHWALTKDAVPTKFSNKQIPTYYDRSSNSRKLPKERSEIDDPSKVEQIPMEIAEERNDDSPYLLEIMPKNNLPSSWFAHQENRMLNYSKLVKSRGTPVPTFHAERQVNISETGIAEVMVKGRHLPNIGRGQPLRTERDVISLLEYVDALSICKSVPNYWMFTNCSGAYRCGMTWVSDTCSLIVKEPDTKCANCLSVGIQLSTDAARKMKSTNNRKPTTSNKVSVLRRRNNDAVRQIRRLKNRNSRLKVEKKCMEKKFKAVETHSLNEAIEKSDLLTSQFKLTLKTAVSLQKAKGKTGRRYPADWILQSLLLKITSPKAYKHLRAEGILPLPNPDYLTSMLKGMKCEFGFSPFVLGSLQNFFRGKPRTERQVFLCFDEMKVKQAIDFDKSNMRFTGFIDYSEFSNEVPKRKGEKLEADHALVFMVRSLNSKLTQPFGSFATRGAAPGGILSKMILSAVVKLEEAGMEVAGVVSDGATNNKSAWKFLGISGKYGSLSNKIPNPCDNSRDVYFLCDAPHIIKCIRNHFQKYKTCKFGDMDICWSFYEALYNIDKMKPLRVAPKLTQHHIYTGPFQKMSVSKAVQVFSKSVADGINFYRTHVKCSAFTNSEATEIFTRQLNDLFDALNARLPFEGLKPGSRGYVVISEFLSCLKETDTFASDLTMASLRVTLQTTLDLVNYLCNDVGLSYVLTAKFNQDCLEKYFGLIRSFGGDNCHPTITSFGHLNRLLSIYNPTARVIKGNVRDDEEVKVTAVSYLEMLRSMRDQRGNEMSDRKSSLENQLLLKIYQDADAIAKPTSEYDQSYSLANAERCVCYYLCGYIAFKGKSFSDCADCVNGLCDNSYLPSDATLTNIKTMGGLKYPSRSLHLLLSRDVEPKIAEISHETIISKCFASEVIDQLDN